MNKSKLYVFLALGILGCLKLVAQISPPTLRCVSVSSPTSAAISWIIPQLQGNLFTQYEIWSSPTQQGSYSMLGVVNTYSATTFTHDLVNVGIQAQYYYVKTISGTNSSISSDTLRSIFINLSNSGNGIIGLNWNALKTPTLNSTSSTYTLSRQAPTEGWTTLYVGNKLNYKDTITFVCKVFYNYKIEISDDDGCVSTSNIKGDTCKNIFPPKIVVIDSVSVNSTGNATIGWPTSTSQDVVKYAIYNDVGGFLTPLDTISGINNTSYTYALPTAATSSQGYCISAGDACGNFSIPSKSHKTIFLNVPTYDLCSRTSSLSWTSYYGFPDGVSQYDVYQSVNGGNYNLIGNSKDLTYKDSQLTPENTYCYFVRARNANLTISASSNSQCFKATGLPGPSYAYINTVSIITNTKQIKLIYSVDNTKPYKGCNILKSTDGKNFTKIAFVPYSSEMTKSYIDKDVKTSLNNYFYKIEVADDCMNPGVSSGISKSIVLFVKNDPEKTFSNILFWDDYSFWNGKIESYSIYRAINDTFGINPIAIIPFGTNTYIDDVENLFNNQGKFTYYVVANEGNGNMYGYKDIAKSNPADAYIDAKIYVPDAFAPKGLNTIWLPMTKFVEKTDYKVTVFNRWGSIVFETKNDAEGWTGSSATDDIYIYLIEYKNARGEYIQLKGHIYMIR